MEIRWRKSSHSSHNGACVEVCADWQKASYSANNGACIEVNRGWQKSGHSAYNGNCVEVKKAEILVGVRDTKQAHLGDNRVILGFSRDAWQRFITSIKEAA